MNKTKNLFEYQPLYSVHGVVSLDGKGDYTSIQACIDKAPSDGSVYVIYVRKGIYREKLLINRPNTILVGESMTDTVITASTANGMLDSQGRIWATKGSRTVCIDAVDITVSNLTIENSFDFPNNQSKSVDDPTRVINTQAVALMISETADRICLKNLNLVSYHDTLYINGGRSYLQDVTIMGTVDFIFGAGTALFESCNLISRNREDVQADEPMGYVCAPSTKIQRDYGFVFCNCNLLRENIKLPAKSYALGRPWHPTTKFDDGDYADPEAIGHAAFINCFIDDHIYGWDKMSGKGQNGEKIWFYPDDSRFEEIRCNGPGSTRCEPTERQLDYLRQYSAGKILSGWEPSI